jgi:hypothetical protein
MRFAPFAFGFALSAGLAALLAFGPTATAEEGAGSGLPAGITNGTLVLQSGTREEGKLSVVQIGGESFVLVEKEPSPRYVNLEHVTYIVPGK